jgi:hypothetical protein
MQLPECPYFSHVIEHSSSHVRTTLLLLGQLFQYIVTVDDRRKKENMFTSVRMLVFYLFGVELLQVPEL